MKKIKETQGSGFYIFSGASSGNSTFVEGDFEARLFSKYFNYFMQDFVNVHDYCVNQNGWIFALSLKSTKTIKTRFKDLKNLDSTKGLEVWRIISERIRLTLSTYVRVVNHMRNRSGSLVHSCYERFCFENKEEALETIEMMRNHVLESRQKEIKYRSLVDHYKQLNNEGKWNEWLCSTGNNGKRNRIKSYILTDVRDLVLQNLVIETKSLHNIQI